MGATILSLCMLVIGLLLYSALHHFKVSRPVA